LNRKSKTCDCANAVKHLTQRRQGAKKNRNWLSLRLCAFA
jgi:hypothetical protein